MPRRCTVCTHDERAAIDLALVAREPFRAIATQYSVSTGALVRHSDDHTVRGYSAASLIVKDMEARKGELEAAPRAAAGAR